MAYGVRTLEADDIGPERVKRLVVGALEREEAAGDEVGGPSDELVRGQPS